VGNDNIFQMRNKNSIYCTFPSISKTRQIRIIGEIKFSFHYRTIEELYKRNMQTIDFIK
jgi:phage FluMu protein gp41